MWRRTSLRSARSKTIKQHLTTYQARLSSHWRMDKSTDKRETTIDVHIHQILVLEDLPTMPVLFVTKVQLDSICLFEQQDEGKKKWDSEFDMIQQLPICRSPYNFSDFFSSSLYKLPVTNTLQKKQKKTRASRERNRRKINSHVCRCVWICIFFFFFKGHIIHDGWQSDFSREIFEIIYQASKNKSCWWLDWKGRWNWAFARH